MARAAVGTSKALLDGTLPEGWHTVHLRDIVREGKRSLDPRDFPDEVFDYYSIPDYQDSGKPSLQRGAAIGSQKLAVRPGTVLFGKLNPRVPKVWRVDPSESTRRKIASTEFIPLDPLEDRADSEFLYYLCWCDFVMAKAQGLVSGSTPSRQRVDPRAFLELTVPIPPLAEQRMLASVLHTVQQAKATTENVIAATREFKRSLMRHLFTYGPVPVHQAESVTLKETEIGSIPEHWALTRLNAAATIVMGQSPPGDSYNIEGRGIPLINGPEEYGPVSPVPKKWTSTLTKVCQSGDVLFCVRGNTLGRLNLADGVYCIGRGVSAIRGHNGVSATQYLYFWFEAEAKRFLAVGRGGGSTFPNITKTQLQAWPIPLPPLEEQHRAANILEVLDRKLRSEIAKREALDVLFQALLGSLMTGQRRLSAMEVA